MATWLLLAIGAQFLSAVTVLVDRHIVLKAEHIGKPVVYAFFVSLLSGFVVVLLPFGVIALPGSMILLLSFANAVCFVAAIIFLYSALQITRASDAAPVIGAVSAITTLVLASQFIEGDVVPGFLLPVLLLAGGTMLISHFHFTRRAIVYTLLSGVAFGAAVLFAKLVFLETTFVDGFFWARMMNVVLACALLLIPSVRRAIFAGGKHSSQGSKVLVVGNKIIGGVGSALTAFAISMGSVSVVNALSGLQFAFLFLFAFLFARYMPIFRDGHTRGHGGWQTGIGVTLIAIGLAFLYVHA